MYFDKNLHVVILDSDTHALVSHTLMFVSGTPERGARGSIYPVAF